MEGMRITLREGKRDRYQARETEEEDEEAIRA